MIYEFRYCLSKPHILGDQRSIRNDTYNKRWLRTKKIEVVNLEKTGVTMNRTKRMEERLTGIIRRMLPKHFVSCVLIGIYISGETKFEFSYVMPGMENARKFSCLEDDNHLSNGELAEWSLEIVIIVSKILSVHTEGRVPRVGNFAMQLTQPKISIFEYDKPDHSVDTTTTFEERE